MSLRGIALIVVLAALLGGGFLLKEQLTAKPATTEAGHGAAGHDHAAEAKKPPTAEKGVAAAEKGRKQEPAHGDEKGGAKTENGHNHAHGDEADEAPEGVVVMSSAQIDKARIETMPATGGNLAKEIIVPGRVTLNGDRQGRVVPKLAGTVAKVTKNIGEPVVQGEVLAIIESRDIADAKADFLSTWRAEELAKSVYDREDRLWRKQATAEQEYITAKNAHQSAVIKLDLAHQRLHSAGFDDQEIEQLKSSRQDGDLRQYPLRSPLAGVVTNRNVTMGQVVGTDREIFTVADLSTVWVEIGLAPADLAFAKIGQEVGVTAGTTKAKGKVVILSPAIDPETRAAKAVVELDNADGSWKLGDFVSAELFAGKIEAGLLLPREAVQTIKGNRVAFVSHAKGFQLKPIVVGREDSKNLEILSGIEFGEAVAVTNTFVLKAELGKAEAEHEH